MTDAATALEALTGNSYAGGLTTSLAGKRIGVVESANAPYPAAIAAVTRTGATTVTKTVGTPDPNPPSIVSRSFETDLNAYLAARPAARRSLQAIVDYNAANPVEGLKYQQGELLGALGADRSAFEADLAAGKASNAALIDALLADTDVIMVPSGNPLVGIADRAGYPVLTVPAGYGTGNAGRNPIGVTFVAKAEDEAGLLHAGYAFEQATNVRLAPSWTNPSMFRCVAGSTFYSPHHCHPGDLLGDVPFGPDETAVAGDVGGTVPPTLALTLGPNATFGAFTPGVARTYTATTTANVISTAADAALSVSEPGHLTNGAYALPSPLQVSLSKAAWTGPVSNDLVTVTFRQPIGATDALRTGTYSRTLTFTLSTTSP